MGSTTPPTASEGRTELIAAIGKGLRIAETLSCDVPLAPHAQKELRQAHEAFAALQKGPPASGAGVREAWCFDAASAPEGMDLLVYRHDGPPVPWSYGYLTIASKEDGEWYDTEGAAITVPAAWMRVFKPEPEGTPETLATAEPEPAIPADQPTQAGVRSVLIDLIRERLASTDYPVSDWEREFADAILSALTSAGDMVLVPREPTRAMCIAAAERADIPLTPKGAAEFWSAMIASAPAAFDGGKDG